MAIEAEALEARPSASELATRVCHEEQLMIWAGEITGSLSAGGYLREDFSYEDILDAGAMVANCIRGIVEYAFGHPELQADLIHRSALAEDTARAAEGQRAAQDNDGPDMRHVALGHAPWLTEDDAP